MYVEASNQNRQTLHIPLNTKDKASQEHIKSACLSAEG